MTIALRPYLAADAAMLADIFRDSIDELAADDYSDGQRAAWMSAADDETAFATRLAKNLTLIATLDGKPAGFASLADGAKIDLLYVHPHFARHGVATALCDALERLAGARGAKRLDADVSDAAKSFFDQRGYVGDRRTTISLDDEWLANTSMHKDLAPVPVPRTAS